MESTEIAEQRTLLEAQVEAFGTGVIVRTPDAPNARELFDELLLAWRDSTVSPASRQSTNDRERPSVEIPALNRQGFESQAYRLTVQVTTAALELHRGRHLMLHAGGIARDDGAVAAIVGPSGRGKTTTIRNLARDYGYLSDETIAITAQNLVLPYRKPLSVIVDGHRDKLQIAPSELGLRPLPDAELHIAGLVLLERHGEEESTVQSVPLAEAMLDLVQQTSYLVELPHPLRRIAEIAEATGGVRSLRAGVPERIADVAEHLFAPGECEPWAQVIPTAQPGLPYRAVDVVDAIECADGTVVLTGDRQLRLLTGVAPIVWRGLCEGDSWAELEERVRRTAGAPPEGSVREALEAVCGEMADVGVLDRR